jgi:hypothetical protein
MTYKEIINRFRTVTENHKQLKDFGYGELSDLKTQSQLGPEDEGVDYPYLFLLPAPSVRQGPVMEYSFNMVVMDMARGEEGDQYDNYITIQSQCQQYIDDVLANLYYYYKDQPEIQLTGITYTPFKEKYQDELAGMTATITIQVPTPLNECIAPFDNYETLIYRRSMQEWIYDYSVDPAPDDQTDRLMMQEWSYDGTSNWLTGSDPVIVSANRSIQPTVTGKYKLNFNLITRWNEPEDGSGRLKYGVRIYQPGAGGLDIKKTIDVAWQSDSTEVTINKQFELDLVAGQEYYFLLGNSYATDPIADIIGYQQIGSSLTISRSE